MEKITIKTTNGEAAAIYALCVEVLRTFTTTAYVLERLVVRELAARLGRKDYMWMDARRPVRITLTPAEAVALRTLLLSSELPPAMAGGSRSLLIMIDPKIPARLTAGQ